MFSICIKILHKLCRVRNFLTQFFLPPLEEKFTRKSYQNSCKILFAEIRLNSFCCMLFSVVKRVCRIARTKVKGCVIRICVMFYMTIITQSKKGERKIPFSICTMKITSFVKLIRILFSYEQEIDHEFDQIYVNFNLKISFSSI